MKSILSFFVLFSIFSSVYAEHKTIYKKIQPINLSSLSWEDEEWPVESFHDYLIRCLNYQLHPQEIKKRRIVFKLFDELAKNQTPEHNVLYDMISAQDLALLAGKEEGESYIDEIMDRTLTQLGKVFLYGLLSSPINNINILKKRQEIIKCLCNDNDLYAQLNDVYGEFAASENALLSLWGQDNFLSATQRHYFAFPFLGKINERLNKSAAFLEAKSLWDHQQRALFLATGIFASFILPLYGISKLTELYTLPESLEEMAKPLQGSGGRIFGLLASVKKFPWIPASGAIIGGIGCALFSKEDYEWARDNVVLDRCIQQKMIMIAMFINSLEKLQLIIDMHPELIEKSWAAAFIRDFMIEKFSEDKMQKLRDYCATSTLQGEPSFFSYQGRVLAAFRLLYDIKDSLSPLLMAIGELEAYLSCARLYNEFQDARVHFCFAEYKEADQPSIVLENFWNPFINPNKVVTNSIDICGPERRNMIITGPNAGGKSTLIKAIPVNLIFAQSIGLAAADKAEITPFQSIATYLNIVDDIASGNSLFKAQVLRAQEMVNLVEQTPKGTFSFVALDEMFNGTSAKESMATAYSVVKHISKYTNNICIVATHFPLLTKLEKELSAFENYKVSVEVSDEKGIFYPFKLEKGSSEQHVALDILKQEGYDCTIVEEASEIIKTVMI